MIDSHHFFAYLHPECVLKGTDLENRICLFLILVELANLHFENLLVSRIIFT